MHAYLKRFWMHAVGVSLIGASVWYWVSLQGTPEYIALRGARILFEDPDAAKGMPWQPDELRALKIDEKTAEKTLKMIYTNFTGKGKLLRGSEFHKVVGKDTLVVSVVDEDGAVVQVPITVINQDGKGVMQFGDLILTARLYCYEQQKQRFGPDADKSVLNKISEMLFDLGIAGYYDISYNSMEPWKSYEPAANPTVASN